MDVIKNNDKNKPEFVDQLLDSALTEYGRVTPRIGLEARVLRRIESHAAEVAQQRAARFAWMFRAATATAAVAVVAVSVWEFRPRAEHSLTAAKVSEQSVVAKDATPAPVLQPNPHPPNDIRARTSGDRPIAPVRPLIAVQHAQAPAATRVPLIAKAMPATPHLAMFPAPAAASTNELLLARVVEHADLNALRSLASAQAADEATIAAGEIPATLQPPMLDTNAAPAPVSVITQNPSRN